MLRRNADFPVQRKKVGKFQKPQASIALSVSSKSLHLSTQSIVRSDQLRSQGALLTRRGLSLADLQTQLRHYNAKTRKDAILGIKELLEADSITVRENASTVLEGMFRLLLDEDDSVRGSSVLVLESFLSDYGEDRFSVHCSRLLPFVTCGLTHLSPSVQMSSVKILCFLSSLFPASLREERGRIAGVLLHLFSTKKEGRISCKNAVLFECVSSFFPLIFNKQKEAERTQNSYDLGHSVAPLVLWTFPTDTPIQPLQAEPKEPLAESIQEFCLRIIPILNENLVEIFPTVFEVVERVPCVDSLKQILFIFRSFSNCLDCTTLSCDAIKVLDGSLRKFFGAFPFGMVVIEGNAPWLQSCTKEVAKKIVRLYLELNFQFIQLVGQLFASASGSEKFWFSGDPKLCTCIISFFEQVHNYAFVWESSSNRFLEQFLSFSRNFLCSKSAFAAPKQALVLSIQECLKDFYSGSKLHADCADFLACISTLKRIPQLRPIIQDVQV